MMTRTTRLGRVILAAVGALALFSVVAKAEGLPKIAVTDLAYEEKVASHFTIVAANEKAGTPGYYSPWGGGPERSIVAASGEIILIERGELHKFTGDIKGALLKSKGYAVTQGRPWTDPENVKIFDVIERIKKGDYPGADYVLFGTITSIESRNEALPIQGTTATNYVLSMELVAEFSLINTKTYEVVAGFSAMGEGNDARLINTPGAVISLSRGKVMRAVSQSLSEEVLAEVQGQFSPPSAGGRPNGKAAPTGDSGKTIIYH